MAANQRTYKVDQGLAEVLTVCMDRFLDEKVAAWRAAIAEGRLTHESREVAIALGWIGGRDSRVTAEVTDRPAPARTRTPRTDPVEEPLGAVSAASER